MSHPAQRWPGALVSCVVCLGVGVPFRDEDDHCWRLPVHGWTSSVLAGRPCPGSLAVVSAAPVPANMEARIEANMVAAMPPPPEPCRCEYPTRWSEGNDLVPLSTPNTCADCGGYCPP